MEATELRIGPGGSYESILGAENRCDDESTTKKRRRVETLYVVATCVERESDKSWRCVGMLGIKKIGTNGMVKDGKREGRENMCG